MKSLFVYPFFAVVSLAAVQSSAGNQVEAITCSGYVSFKDGTMEGNSTVRIVRQSDGRWIMNDFIDAGENLSDEDSRLSLDTYSSFLTCSGATVEYNHEHKVMSFRYKYGSGILGGGCQKTQAVFTDCKEE